MRHVYSMYFFMLRTRVYMNSYPCIGQQRAGKRDCCLSALQSQRLAMDPWEPKSAEAHQVEEEPEELLSGQDSLRRAERVEERECRQASRLPPSPT